jgi:hypothetical protein
LVKNNRIHLFKKAVYTGSLLCLFLLLGACETFNDPKIASLADFDLRESELNYQLNQQPWNKELEDSIINQWIKKTILLTQFDSLSLQKQREINIKINDYKSALIRFELENILIQQQLDTLVTEEELISYYNENKKDFELSDFIVKVLYLKIPSNAPDIDKINRLYTLRQAKDTAQVISYANKYAANFFYHQDKWIYFDDLLKEIPLEGIDKEKFILNKTKTNFEENGYIYYLNILDYRLKNAPSPFSLEREHIRQRILTRRIREIRETLEQELIDKALKKHEIHYYTR